MKSELKLLITTRADEGIKEMTDITHPLIKKYAQRVGADFMVLDHTPPSDSGDGRPHYRILKHYDLHEEYDRILHIDSDMIIVPGCPDIFEAVPYEKIGTVLEDKGSRKHARHQLIKQSQEQFGNIGWTEDYINTGLFLTSRCHKDIYQPINGQYWTGFGSDDIQLGYLIKKHQFEIIDLPFQYNHMTMFSEPWNNSPNRFKSYLIHYGGRGVFDSHVSTKMEQMRKDYERLYGKALRILFVGVFDTDFRSTNTSQLLSFKKIGQRVVGYNYRAKSAELGPVARDAHLLKTVQTGDFDLVVYSKCNAVGYDTFQKINEVTKTCLWFMDPLQTYDDEMRQKTQLVDYFCCDKQNVLEQAIQLNPRSYRVCEGYNQEVDMHLPGIEKEYDVSFIGNTYGKRQEVIAAVNHPIKLLSNAYGRKHAVAVNKSKINLNFCTDAGASDRVYKVLGAGGFLLTDDWDGRENDFEDMKDLVIFDGIDDLNAKIAYFLAHPEEATQIALQGHTSVQKFNRLHWASEIVKRAND